MSRAPARTPGRATPQRRAAVDDCHRRLPRCVAASSGPCPFSVRSPSSPSRRGWPRLRQASAAMSGGLAALRRHGFDLVVAHVVVHLAPAGEHAPPCRRACSARSSPRSPARHGGRRRRSPCPRPPRGPPAPRPTRRPAGRSPTGLTSEQQAGRTRRRCIAPLSAAPKPTVQAPYRRCPLAGRRAAAAPRGMPSTGQPPAARALQHEQFERASPARHSQAAGLAEDGPGSSVDGGLRRPPSTASRTRRRTRTSPPGSGSKARTRRSISSAGCRQSIARLVLVDLVRRRSRLRPAAARGASAPQAAASSACDDEARAQPGEPLVQAWRWCRRRRSPALRPSASAPVSRPSSICMIVMPVRVSPASIARWIGAAPRQRGSSEAWMLRQPRRGSSSTHAGRISP